MFVERRKGKAAVDGGAAFARADGEGLVLDPYDLKRPTGVVAVFSSWLDWC
ncbi:unnamed protein product [Linum tenue]|uniref:Uncharacterized protein n=1 Tax=Linum tenue TaxID=586396 RepID=A0AAV0ISA0_9ROSI|nr:unnamed protein product [Linum tenue]